MRIEVQEVEYCKLNVLYEADPDQVENKRTEVLQYFKDAPVPGNRKGRASENAIRIYYYSQIEEALKQAMAEFAFHDACAQKDIKVFGTPQFSDVLLKRNNFSCSFSINKKPEFELAPYKEMEIPKQHTNFDLTSQVELILDNLRNRFGESTPYGEDDVVEMKDIIIIDCDTFDGETKIESASGQGQIITVGTSGLDDLDQNLLGMKLNESRTIMIKAPETSLPSLAGKTIKVVVSLIMGSKVVPMPLNDELAKKAGKQDFDDLRGYVAGLAQAKQQETERQAIVEQIMLKLVAANDIKVPSFLVESEARHLAHNVNSQWETMVDADREEFLKMAEKNVKLSLILSKIRENEPEAQLSDQEVLATIEQNLGKTKDPQEVDKMMMELNQSGKLPVLAARIRDEFTFDFLVKNSKIVE